MHKRFVHHRTMHAGPDLSRLAKTLGDPTRIRILNLLMEGRALTAKELSYGSGVEPATGTAHLQKLLEDRLVAARVQGRHKYFQLASADVAHCVEAMMAIARPSKSNNAEKLSPMQAARFCYDHLAGRLAVQITSALVARKVLQHGDGEFIVTRRGERWFRDFGIDLDAVRHSRRRFATACLDWTERKDHLGGALGATLAAEMIQKRWIARTEGNRVVGVTPYGKRAMREHVGVSE